MSKDDVIVDPRIMEMFGGDEEVVSVEEFERRSKVTIDMFGTEPEVVKTSIDVPSPSTIPRSPSISARYEYFKKADDTCFFCNSPATNTYYKPLQYDVRAKGPHGEMKAYRVCGKCLARADRKGSMSHLELISYIHTLESRGSVRGRVVLGRENYIRTSSMTLSLDSDLLSCIKADIRIVSDSHGPIDILNIESMSGKIIIQVR